jgi:hypothetical protein
MKLDEFVHVLFPAIGRNGADSPTLGLAASLSAAKMAVLGLSRK